VSFCSWEVLLLCFPILKLWLRGKKVGRIPRHSCDYCNLSQVLTCSHFLRSYSFSACAVHSSRQAGLSISVCIRLHDLLRNSKFGRASRTKTPIFLQLYSLSALLSFFFFLFSPLEIFIFLRFSIVMCSTIAWIDGFLRNHSKILEGSGSEVLQDTYRRYFRHFWQ
jgi:hypothetical protein